MNEFKSGVTGVTFDLSLNLLTILTVNCCGHELQSAKKTRTNGPKKAEGREDEKKEGKQPHAGPTRTKTRSTANRKRKSSRP